MNEEMKNTEKRGWRCGPRWFLFPILGAVAVFGFGAIVMYLWNWLIPSIFTSLGSIDIWHAIGLLILSKILFGGFRKGGWGGRCGCGRGYGWRGHRGMYWKEKWMNMSEEEKEKFKDEWKKRCGSENC